jgi:hypothetical protein
MTEKARKYKFTNNSKTLMIHVKELRKALSPGKSVEWEGILNANTKRIVDLKVEDLGEPTNPVKLDRVTRRKALAEKEQELTSNVREILAKTPNKKAEGKGKAEPVKASDIDVPDVKPEKKEESRLDSLLESNKKKSAKKSE